MIKYLGKATDALHIHTEQQILQSLMEDGPPYIFASKEPVEVGMTFHIVDQPFSVRRLTNHEEYKARMIATDRPFYCGTEYRCFFEASTD